MANERMWNSGWLATVRLMVSTLSVLPPLALYAKERASLGR
jgi:hypothetical protein